MRKTTLRRFDLFIWILFFLLVILNTDIDGVINDIKRGFHNSYQATDKALAEVTE